LLQMYADLPEEIASIGCGHIGVVLGLKQTKTGDTLLHPQHPSLARAHKGAKRSKAAAQSEPEAIGLQLHGVAVPPPVFFCAVEADSPQDEKPLADALANLLLEDPSLRISYDAETGQTLLSGMGELHLEIVRDRLLRDMKIAASFGAMRVSYREMAGRPTTVDHVYAKEVAGKVGKAAMRITVSSIEPSPDESGAEAAASSDSNEIEVDVPETLATPDGTPATGEQRDTVLAAIEGGIRSALFRGSLLGFPVARTRVHVSDVQFFGEDMSTPAAYRACAGQTLLRALGACHPVLLEPIARVSIQCPEAALGSVLGDLNGTRRGRVLSLEDAESGALDASKLLIAEAPMSAMVGYSSALRSLTAGAATFSLEVVGFGAMSAQQQQRIINESRGLA
ncbi:Ribosome-releasing factor 2, mitochondrial, partial [Coemansia spiralis]